MARASGDGSDLTTVTIAQLNGGHGPRHRFIARVVEKLPLTSSLDCEGQKCAYAVLKDKEGSTIVLQVFEEDEAGAYAQLQVGREYAWVGCMLAYRHRQHPWLQRQDPKASTACAMHIENMTIVQFTQGSWFQATTQAVSGVDPATNYTPHPIVASKCSERYHPITPRRCAVCRNAYHGGKQLLCLSCTCNAMHNPDDYAQKILGVVQKYAPPSLFETDADVLSLIALLREKVATPASETDTGALAIYTRYVVPLVFKQSFFDGAKQTSIVHALVTHLTLAISPSHANP